MPDALGWRFFARRLSGKVIAQFARAVHDSIHVELAGQQLQITNPAKG